MTINIKSVYERKNINSPYDSLVEECEKGSDMAAIIKALEGCLDEILWKGGDLDIIIPIDYIAIGALLSKGKYSYDMKGWEWECGNLKKYVMFFRFAEIARLYEENGFILTLPDDLCVRIKYGNCMTNLIKRSKGYKKINIKTSDERRKIKSKYDLIFEKLEKKDTDSLYIIYGIESCFESKFFEHNDYLPIQCGSWEIADIAAKLKREDCYTGVDFLDDQRSMKKTLEYCFDDIALLYKERGFGLRLQWSDYGEPPIVYVGQCKGCKECTIGNVYEDKDWLDCKRICQGCKNI